MLYGNVSMYIEILVTIKTEEENNPVFFYLSLCIVPVLSFKFYKISLVV